MQDKKTWRLMPGNLLLERSLRQELGCSGIMARLLINRGVFTAQEARRFISGSLTDLHHPIHMQDAEKAAKLIGRALEHREKILVYGDYDVDGMTATALMVKVLRHLGGQVDYFIPERNDGYGLKEANIRKAADEGYRLVVTVDTGVTATAEIEIAGQLGLDVVVTDHHEPNGRLPDVPVVNPKRPDCTYPFKELAGVGVAFKLALAICPELAGSNLEKELLGLICLGTVADIVPLLGENRIFVRYGLECLRTNPGLNALVENAGLNRELVVRDLSFVIAPRLNAAGRVGQARQGVELLMADATEAALIASELASLNTYRQDLESTITAQVLAEMAAWSETPSFPVFCGEGWHVGILGILASRFAHRLQRPLAFLSMDGDIVRGSARSVPAVDLFQVFKEGAHLFTDFGGHKQAVGFSLRPEALPEFKRLLNEQVAAALESGVGVFNLEAAVTFEEITPELITEIETLQPWGYGNQEPVLLVPGVSLKECREVGKNGGHLKLGLSHRGRFMHGIAFRAAGMREEMEEAKLLDLAFTPVLNEWNGRREVEVKMLDWRPAADIEETIGRSEREDGLFAAALRITEAEPVVSEGLEGVLRGSVAPHPVSDSRLRRMVDYRGHGERSEVLCRLLKGGRRALVSVGNPDEAVTVWAHLGRRLQETGWQVCFVHRSLNEDELGKCRQQYRSGMACLLVGTPEMLAADIADDVFIWSLPHTEAEWRQLSGLGERLVLAYTDKDFDRNWSVLRSLAPNRRILGLVFQLVKMKGPVTAESVYRQLYEAGIPNVGPWTVKTGIRILVELGLAENQGGSVLVIPAPARRSLVNSPTFQRIHKLKRELATLQRYYLRAPAVTLAAHFGCDIIAPGEV